MPYKLVIGDKGKSWKYELSEDSLVGKSVGDKVNGKDVKADFEGYEFEITGGSDSSGFPLNKDVEGIGLKKTLLKKGWGMWKRPRRNKKKLISTPDGLRKRKTLRGKVISEKVVQINLKVLKHGAKKLHDIFPEQNVKKEEPKKVEAAAPAAA
jgi:small subunit ribosomal protein S6e